MKLRRMVPLQRACIKEVTHGGGEVVADVGICGTCPTLSLVARELLLGQASLIRNHSHLWARGPFTVNYVAAAPMVS